MTTVLPYTTTELLRLEGNAYKLQRLALAAFTEAETAPVRFIQDFWDEFVKAHARIYRGGTERAVV